MDDIEEKKDAKDIREIIPLKDCQSFVLFFVCCCFRIFAHLLCIYTVVNGGYELYVNYKFEGGSSVSFKMKTKFESSDKRKWKNSESPWSPEQTLKIPKEDNAVIFNIELNGKSSTLSLEGNDIALTSFDDFQRRFLNEFGKQLKVLIVCKQ